MIILDVDKLVADQIVEMTKHFCLMESSYIHNLPIRNFNRSFPSNSHNPFLNHLPVWGWWSIVVHTAIVLLCSLNISIDKFPPQGYHKIMWQKQKCRMDIAHLKVSPARWIWTCASLKYVIVCLYTFSGQWCILYMSVPVISTHLQLSTPSPPVELLAQIRVMKERTYPDTDQLPHWTSQKPNSIFLAPVGKKSNNVHCYISFRNCYSAEMLSE